MGWNNPVPGEQRGVWSTYMGVVDDIKQDLLSALLTLRSQKDFASVTVCSGASDHCRVSAKQQGAGNW